MKIAYITSQAPYDEGEWFILPEILELVKRNIDVIVLPVRPNNKQSGQFQEALQVKAYSIFEPVLSKKVIFKAIEIYLKNPVKATKVLFAILFKSNGLKNTLKNLYVFPKGLFIGGYLKNSDVNHIHVHWASTTSTAAYVAACISGIPWSITTHRHDLEQNNMCREKAKKAQFIRVINKAGYDMLVGFIGQRYKHKCKIIRCGVDLPKLKVETQNNKRDNDVFRIAVPARLVYEKGHEYLIDAIKIVSKDYKCVCHLFGNGDLYDKLKNMIEEYKLEQYFVFEGLVNHEKLLAFYENRMCDCVLLSSVIEGISVALMEAMAYKMPVIATDVGGTWELLGDGSGLMVDAKNPQLLAEAIKKLINSKEQRLELGQKGYEKVQAEFSLSNNMDKLIGYIKDKDVR